MLKPILGSENSERTLIFLLIRREGYAADIARFYDKAIYGFQKQLDRLEEGGVLFSRKMGRTRMYAFNPRYPFLHDLEQLLKKAFSYYPEKIKEDLLMNRRQPRRRGKPL